MTKKPIPIEETAVYPLVGMTYPSNITFSQDGKEIRFLSGSPDDPTQKLYAVNIETGEKRVLIEAPDGGVSEDKLSPEEELRRQRLRMLATGITSYGTTSESERIMIPLMGDVYVWDSENGLKHVVDTAGGAPALNPAMTADGKSVAYVQDAEIYVASVEDGESRQITTGARGTGKTNGLAEFIAQEELGRMDGFWWSPEGTKIAFTEVDEIHIPIYRIMHQGKDEVGDTAQEDHAYPFAGAENAKVRLATISAGGGEPIFMDTNFGEEVYFRSVFWWDDTRLGAEVLNREQDKMWLVEFDRTGERTDILVETSDVWLNRRGAFFSKLKSGKFLNCSQQSGFNHIYYHDENGKLITQLTSGDWIVDGIEMVDEKNSLVYFTGSIDDPREQHLYSVSLEGGEITQITQAAGTHTVKISPDYKYYVDIFHSIDTPPTVTLNNLSDGAVVHTLHSPNDPRLEQYAFPPPEMVELENRDGTKLCGAIYRPDSGEAPYPTIVYVYGGPGPQLVRNSWGMSINMRAQYLRQQGFLVFTVDNRGSARRGLEFEGSIKERMGTIEVDDQVDGVNWLIEQGLTIPERVGVYGWSYGGYMTLMCLAKAPDVFKVGVSGAPVSAWDGYDTAYTERYMSTPQKNPEGYRTSNVMEYVQHIRGKLLLIHGMLDENVHFRHTARLINALIRHRIPYDLLLFPDERHMPRREADRVYLNEHLFGYFEKHL